MAGVKRKLVIHAIDIGDNHPDPTKIPEYAATDIARLTHKLVKRFFNDSHDEDDFQRFIKWYRGYQREYAKTHPGYAEAHPDDFPELAMEGGETY